MDLHEVYGLRNLINAETQRQRQMSYSQMRGGAEAHRIRDMLSEAMMRAFVLMDFGEHVDMNLDELHERLHPILKEVLQLESRAKGAEIVHRGLRAVILGRPNTGKSSLMNGLAQRDVAIVSDRAGTTRDSIEVRLNIAGVPMSLTDTAGIRDAEDSLEKEGVERAKRKILEADVVIAVVDASDAEEETSSILAELEELAVASLPVIVVRNKLDLARGKKFSEIESTARLDVVDCLETCALTLEGVQPLLKSLENLVNSLCPDDSGPCMTDTQLLSEAREELENALSVRDTALLCDHLQRALDIFGQMAGSTVSEQILDDLFKQFCIGK
ncbi:tRNA modification GTPase GTPBP3 mitochondrial [Trichostrongylus colubriformis]|uniref:tRNA modification GTPase GTPBP3 mitochondrial n=1 Tax=Trichostrongylus colubriformis TaxID=6319 RepID=A0AAN8FV12_TRICO